MVIAKLLNSTFCLEEIKIFLVTDAVGRLDMFYIGIYVRFLAGLILCLFSMTWVLEGSEL